MSYNDVNDDFAKALLEGSDWAKAGLKVSKDEPTNVVEESTDVDSSDEVVEVHSCPLCLTELNEAISDDQIIEHLDNVFTIMEIIEENSEGEDDEVEEGDDEGDDEAEGDSSDDSEE